MTAYFTSMLTTCLAISTSQLACLQSLKMTHTKLVLVLLSLSICTAAVVENWDACQRGDTCKNDVHTGAGFECYEQDRWYSQCRPMGDCPVNWSCFDGTVVRHVTITDATAPIISADAPLGVRLVHKPDESNPFSFLAGEYVRTHLMVNGNAVYAKQSYWNDYFIWKSDNGKWTISPESDLPHALETGLTASSFFFSTDNELSFGFEVFDVEFLFEPPLALNWFQSGSSTGSYALTHHAINGRAVYIDDESENFIAWTAIGAWAVVPLDLLEESLADQASVRGSQTLPYETGLIFGGSNYSVEVFFEARENLYLFAKSTAVDFADCQGFYELTEHMLHYREVYVNEDAGRFIGWDGKRWVIARSDMLDSVLEEQSSNIMAFHSSPALLHGWSQYHVDWEGRLS